MSQVCGPMQELECPRDHQYGDGSWSVTMAEQKESTFDTDQRRRPDHFYNFLFLFEDRVLLLSLKLDYI